MRMPRYKCHKVVQAMKLRDVAKCLLVPEDPEHGTVQVTREYMDKHRPHAGGYYVVYEDGYESFSPADVFEAGYTRLMG